MSMEKAGALIPTTLEAIVRQFVTFLTSPGIAEHGRGRAGRGGGSDESARVVVRAELERRDERCCGKCFSEFVAESHTVAFFEFELFDILRLFLLRRLTG